jgi:hypothetical protein
MPRVSIEVAAERRARVHELRAQGLSLREISARTGLCLASVRNFLARDPGDSRVDELHAAVAIKAASPDLSSREIKDRYALGVGEATIQRRFADAGLSLPRGRRSLGLRRYWMDEKPSTYLDMLQIDTVKLRDSNGVLHEYLSARDVYSGAHALLPHNPSESGMLRNVRRLFAIFGGVPRVVQADNGTTDFSMPRRNRLRPWMQWAIAAGVRRIQFIPEAEPQRNGAVESFHSWIKQRMDHEFVSGDLDKFLRDRLLYYNHIRSLSTTRKTPASRAPNFCLDRESLDVALDESRWSRGECCVSFVRLALRDRESRAVVAVVRSPGTVYVLPDEFEGSYVRLDVYANRGELWMPVTVAGEVGRVDGRLQAGAEGALVGSFDSPFVNDSPVVVPSVTDVPADAQIVDTAAVVRRWARILKQACPTLLPGGYETRAGDSGAWEVWYKGELVWTEQSSPEVIEHATEAL